MLLALFWIYSEVLEEASYEIIWLVQGLDQMTFARAWRIGKLVFVKSQTGKVQVLSG